jgi:hypothetical protein
MRNQINKVLLLSLALFTFVGIVSAQTSDRSLVITLSDGRRQSFALSEVLRIEFKDGATLVLKDGHQKAFKVGEITRIELSPVRESQFGRNHFLGKWEVGNGAGSNLFITLESNGEAQKTLGASHGTWVVVDGEARISWDDGWHDVIRKAGTKHEKVAFAPGKSFSDDPDNLTNAKNTNPEPL